MTRLSPPSTQISISPGVRSKPLGYSSAFPCPFRMQVLNPFFLNHSETWMAASFSLTFAFSSIWHCIIHCRSKSLLIPTSAGGNFWIPSKRMPTKHCFWAIRYSSFQSASFKETGISLAEPMQNRKKSKKIFCCFNIKLYFCTHETSHTYHIVLHSSYHPPSDSLAM